MIEITGLTKTYDKQDRPAVEDLHLTQRPGTFLTLLGPSGCGKSTTLRSIAGLEAPDAGSIKIGDRQVFSAADRINLMPSRRSLGMVAQSYAVWPHMTVAQNVEYPLKRGKVPRAERRERVAAVLEQVGLGGFADRPTPDLSGGQQQRVALARAIVSEPDVLLLDEPLSNLDARLRRELGTYLRELQQRLKLSVVYVTHDQDEALAMSDTVVLMDRGEILENGSPEEVYGRPRTLRGATFVGSANHLSVADARRHADGWVADSALGRIRFCDPHDLAVSGANDVIVRPEDVTVHPLNDAGLPGRNEGRATVVGLEFRGMYWETKLQTADGTLLCARTFGPKSWELAEQVTVAFAVGASKCVADSDRDAAGTAKPDAELAVAS
jgi:iron(III) transport system ATP-binding protein